MTPLVVFDIVAVIVGYCLTGISGAGVVLMLISINKILNPNESTYWGVVLFLLGLVLAW